MSLRHFFIASSLILAPITTLGFGSAALADTATDSIILSGTVESQIAINATPTTDSTNLPMTQLSESGANVVRVANLDITSNNPAGITIEASSTNNGKLKTTNGDEIAYRIAIVNNNSGIPSSVSTVSSFGLDVTSGFDPDTGVKQMDLYIDYTVGGMPKQGNYSDTLTITVADN
ncbi:MAG: hypothetical protein ACKPH7_16425 [Planktothrix sp.]|uniref:hypothetical protein n=1 Tax=Planktothrix sp. TaxID=3088171 RepID=UPI0038D50FEB